MKNNFQLVRKVKQWFLEQAQVDSLSQSMQIGIAAQYSYYEVKFNALIAANKRCSKWLKYISQKAKDIMRILADCMPYYQAFLL